MPHLDDRVITRAWRFSNETGRIHYVAVRPDGSDRHLITDKGDPLYEVIDAHLVSLGYTGPANTKA